MTEGQRGAVPGDSGPAAGDDQTAGRHAAPEQSHGTDASASSDRADAPAAPAAPDAPAGAAGAPEPSNADAATSSTAADPGTQRISEQPTVETGAATQTLDPPRDQPAAAPTRRMTAPVGRGPVRRGPGPGPSGGRRAARLVAGVLRTVGYLVAAVLVAYVVLVVVGVNTENAIAQLVAGAADAVVLSFRDLFIPADPRWAVAANYGTAALFWVVVAELAAKLVRSAGRLF